MASKILTLRCTKDVQWDDWGRIRTVFKRGELVEVEIYENPTHSGWGSATYTDVYGEKYTDFVPLTSFQHLDGSVVTS